MLTLSGHMQALETFGQSSLNWGPLLTHLITTKLDKNMSQEWKIKSSKDKITKVSNFIIFLEN